MNRLGKNIRKIKRFKRRHPKQAAALGVVLIAAVAITCYSVYMTQRRLSVDPQTYQPLLQLIGEAESNGNYNAYFGNGANQEIKFTDMTVAEVLNWQDDFVAKGSPSSAVGKYQFLNTTLRSLVDSGQVDIQQTFDKPTQDNLAMALIDRRGGEAYVNQELTSDDFAASLAQEWASLPKITQPNPEQSFYQSNLNAALVEPNQLRQAVRSVDS